MAADNPLRKITAGTAFGALFIVVGLILNVAVFFAPIDYSRLGDLVYPGIFLLTLIANATVFVPIPYVPVVVNVAQVAPSVVLLIACAAAGSAIGESVSFFLGRAGERAVSDSRIYRWLHRVADRPFLSGVVLFVLAAPLNPFFDVAGLAAGALGFHFRVFLSAVFLARFVRFAAIVWIGSGLVRI